MLENSCEHLRPTLIRMLRAGMSFREGSENLLDSNGYDVHVFQVGDEASSISFKKKDEHKAHVRCDHCDLQVHVD